MGLRMAAAFLAQQLVLLVRDRQVVFWNVGFFLILLGIFLGPLSGGDASVRVTIAAGLVTTHIMANALFGVAVGLTAARERGVFRRYGVTPLPPAMAVGGAIAGRVVVVLAAAGLMIGVATAGFGVPWTGGILSWVAIVVGGTAAFAGIGFAIAAHAPAPHVANTISNLVFIPMLALGGAALPATMMPARWAGLHGILPSAVINEGLLGAFVGGETVADNLARVGYLIAWAAVTAAWASYRWRTRDA